MNSIGRTVIRLKKSPIKTLTLFLIMSTLGIIVIFAFIFSSALQNTEKFLLNRFPAIVTVIYEEEDTVSQEILTRELITQMADQSFVVDYHYTIGTGFGSEGLFNYPVYSFDFQPYLYLDREDAMFMLGSIPTFLLNGVSRSQFIQLEQGFLSLTQGRTFLDTELQGEIDSEGIPIILSEALAQQNNFELDSIITLYDIIHVPWPIMEGFDLFAEENIAELIPYYFHIIGFFDLVEDRIEFSLVDMSNMSAMEQGAIVEQRFSREMQVMTLNQLFVPNWFIETAIENKMTTDLATWRDYGVEDPVESGMWVTTPRIAPIFILENQAYVSEFIRNSNELLPEFYTFVDMSILIGESFIASMRVIEDISHWIMIGSIVSTIAILALLIILILQDRKKEIGIYLVLGDKKNKILTQYLLEIILIGCIAMVFSILIGTPISNNIARTTLISQLEHQEENTMRHFTFPNTFGSLGMHNHLSHSDMIEAFEISLDVRFASIFLISGILTISVSSAIPICYALTKPPKKLLE